jgi:hypothetical protein
VRGKNEKWLKLTCYWLSADFDVMAARDHVVAVISQPWAKESGDQPEKARCESYAVGIIGF